MAKTTTIFEACKKRKRTPNIFTIDSFATPESPLNLRRSFRENIRLFLKECSEREDYIVGNKNPIWCTLFVSETNGVVFPLYTVEEHVQQSSNPLCNLCRCVGWSHHFVSKRRYHLIIPEDEKWNKPLNMDSLELATHLLHGVIHCNGFGHLLSINGSKSDSNYLTGEEIMNLWDRLCTNLHTRKVSIHDLLMKRSMELRLLHGVTYGCSWFGKWGYKFCHGSFGITEHKYSRAIQILSSLDLKKIIDDFSNRSHGKTIQQIIQCYVNASNTQLVTISDLFQFMLDFESRSPIRRKTTMALSAIPSKFSTKTKTTHQQRKKTPSRKIKPVEFESVASFSAKFHSRWSVHRLQSAAQVLVKILEEHKASMNRGDKVSRQELREEARKYIGDTGLLDFLIKNIHKVVVDSRIICRSTNPVTRLLEFSLEDDAMNGEEVQTSTVTTESDTDTLPPEPEAEPAIDVYEDILKLYKNVLLGYPESHTVSLATRTILDSKNFVKEWQFKANEEEGEEEEKLLRLICQVMPSYDELVTELSQPLPPAELVLVPQHLTVDEVKLYVQCALRDTYCIMDKFVVTDIRLGKMKKMEDHNRLQLGAGECDGVEVWVRGYGLDLDTELRYEGGIDNWMVDCVCGAKDDDGEKMVACDVCQVWQHTRCSSIEDDEVVPSVFLCRRCCVNRFKLCNY